MRISKIPATLIVSLATAAPVLHAQVAAPASGFALWIRLPGTSAQEVTAATAASPRFAVGFRTGRIQVGVGFGHAALRITERDSFDFQAPDGTVIPRTTEDKVTAALFQIGPTVLFDIWRSDDRRTRANLGAGLGIGRLSLVERDQFVEFPSGDVQSSEDKATGALLGFHFAIGGDHFLHPHFALGAETGYQGTVAFDVEEDIAPPTGDRVTVGANGTYVALRATVVF